jgi:hypothetical protein
LRPERFASYRQASARATSVAWSSSAAAEVPPVLMVTWSACSFQANVCCSTLARTRSQNRGQIETTVGRSATRLALLVAAALDDGSAGRRPAPPAPGRRRSAV